MRNPQRIDNLSTTLTAIWKRHPDLRFGQLISNFESYVREKKNIMDIFYIEDEVLEIMLIEFEKDWLGKY